MTHTRPKAVSILIHPWMNRAVRAIILSLLIPGQLVFAQAIPVQAATRTAPIQLEPTIAQVIQPTVQEVLLDVCASSGYGQECAQTLLGMLWNESSNRSTVIGDNGQARGYFQIHYRLHNISIACAEDLICAANWSLNYLEAHSYPKYLIYAVQCHNSCNVNNGYAARALRNGKRFWNKPLDITQAAPIELASN